MFLGGAPTPISHFFCLSICLSVRCAPYLRNITSSLGKRTKKQPTMKNNYMCHAPYLRNSVACDHDFLYTCDKWWYLLVFFFFVFCFLSFFFFFFIFSKLLIFWVVSGKKGQKMAQNNKKKTLLCLISQEPYIIWSSFMLHMFKRIISPGVSFTFFPNFNFGGQ